MNHAPAFFDLKKLEWMNKEYLRAMSADDFVEAAAPWLAPDRAPWPPERFDEAVFRTMAPYVQERIGVLGEVPDMVDFLFLEEPLVDEGSWESVVNDDAAPAILEAALDSFSDCEWTAEALHSATQALADDMGRKLNKAQAPIRVAVTGRRVGPPLFQSLEVLGREAVRERLRAARDRLGRCHRLSRGPVHAGQERSGEWIGGSAGRRHGAGRARHAVGAATTLADRRASSGGTWSSPGCRYG